MAIHKEQLGSLQISEDTIYANFYVKISIFIHDSIHLDFLTVVNGYLDAVYKLQILNLQMDLVFKIFGGSWIGKSRIFF